MVDTLIYAEFLPDSDSLLNLPILTIIRSSLEKEILMYDDNDDETVPSQLPFETANSLHQDKEGLSMDLLAEDSATEPEEEAGEEDEEEEEELSPLSEAALEQSEDEEAIMEVSDEEEGLEEVNTTEGEDEVVAVEEEGKEEEGVGAQSEQGHGPTASSITIGQTGSSGLRDRQSAAAEEIRRRLELLPFVDLSIVCMRKRKPSNPNSKKEPGSGDGEGESDEDDDDDEVLEDVKLPPVRVRLARQKPLYDQQILSSLFDAAEKEEQDRGTVTAANTSLLHRISSAVRFASYYLLTYSVQYLAIHLLLIVFFKEVYIKKYRS